VPPKPRSTKKNAHALRAITTPLGFYVLALLIIESTMCVVLTAAKLSEEKVWIGFLWMIGLFIGVVIIVTLFAWISPRHLLYGKEEHSKPELEQSALRDQIEDLIYANVKSECLQNANKKQNLTS
jgi:hypothetical protein